MKKQTGNEDQRYCNRADHDAARKWSQRQARAEDKKWTKADQRANLRRLVEAIEGLDLTTKKEKHNG